MGRGIPRVRTKYSLDVYKGRTLNSQTKRVELGRLFLEVTPGELKPMTLLGHLPPYIDVSSTSVASGACCRDELHPGPPYTEGGAFTKVSVDLPEQRVAGNGHYNSADVTRTFYGLGTGRVHYVGGFHPEYIATGLDIPSMVTGYNWVPSTEAWEEAAYKRTRPKIQKADGAVFAAEARDIPRMLKNVSRNFHDIWKEMGGQHTRIMKRDRIADDFLNHQFGWLPFVNDMRKFYSTYQNASAAKAQLTARNDKWTRRRVLLDRSTNRTVLYQGPGMQVVPAGDIIGTLFRTGSSPYYDITQEIESNVNAVGSYRYYRPEFDASMPDYNSAWNSVQRDLTLYGVRVTPSNVYNATPWTWLVDWFTGFGDNVDKMSAIISDGLVAKYLYVMRHVTTRVTLKQRLPFWNGDVTLEWSYNVDAKVRREAPGPYGFGLSWQNLSPRQLAILAALKITH